MSESVPPRGTRSRSRGSSGPRASERAPAARASGSSGGRTSDAGQNERRERRGRTRSEEPKPSSNVAFLIVAALGLVVAVVGSYLLIVYPRSTGPGTGRDVELTFERDEATPVVLKKLEEAGLVASPGLFSLYVRFVGLHPEPGHHLVTDDVSPEELVHRLERRGSSSRAKVTVPEGFTRFDIAKRLQSLHVATGAAFLEATSEPSLLRELAIVGDSAEGYLFPATYEFPLDSDPREIVRRMKAEFEKRYAALEQNHRLGIASLESTLGWTRREILTLASMVEKEAAVDDERPIIASVFLNRLRDPAFKRRVLQCDPTAGYGCLVLKDRVPACANYAGKITHAVNVDPLNTYSTYVHEGLPPGPIANPGEKSLQAVLGPSTTKYLYFVAREGRRHAFSETLDEHNTAVKDLRERTTR